MRCNWETVDVFQAVLPDIAVGMGGAVPIGISAQEIQAALLIRGTPPSQWRAVSDGVHIMFAAAQRAAHA